MAGDGVELRVNGYSITALASRWQSSDAAVEMRVEVDVSGAHVNDVLGFLDGTYRESDDLGTAVFSELKDTGLFINATELVFVVATREETETNLSNVASTSFSTGLFAVIVAGTAIIILMIIVAVSLRRANRKVRATKARLSAYHALMSPFDDSRRASTQMPRKSDYSMLNEHRNLGAAMMADAVIMRELRAASRADSSIVDIDETRVTHHNPVCVVFSPT